MVVCFGFLMVSGCFQGRRRPAGIAGELSEVLGGGGKKHFVADAR